MPGIGATQAKVQALAVIGEVAVRGCADASLYRRCRDAGLELQLAGPQFGALGPGPAALPTLQGPAFFLAWLGPAEAEEWHVALAAGLQAGTLAAAAPFHCAVGRKP